MGAHVTDSIPNQSCCNVPPLCLHLGVKTWPTVASWATTQHLFGNNKQKRHIFLSFPPSQVQYINTLKSIFVEIQKYYGQLSRWFYAKLLENIKAPEGKQTLRRHDMLIIGCFERCHPASLRLRSRLTTTASISLPYIYTHRKQSTATFHDHDVSPLSSLNQLITQIRLNTELIRPAA